MKTQLCALFLALLTLGAGLPTSALAQAPAPEPPPTAVEEPMGEEGWALYHRAFELFVDGEVEDGKAQLRRLVDEHPGHPAAMRAGALLALLAPKVPADAEVGAAARPVDAEKTSGLSRAELAIFQTLHGIAVGAEACLLIADQDCEARPLVASLIGGGAAGIGLSLWLTTDGITPGQTTALDSGVLWGLWNATAITFIADIDGTRPVTATLLLGQLGGLGAGAALYSAFEPRAGDVAMINSGGIWAGMLALFAHGVDQFEASDEVIWGTLLAASDLGGLAGALASSHYPMSRARSLIIDSGGVVGGLVGIGTPVLIMGEDVEPEPVFLGGMFGILGGLGVTTYLTRDWDAEGDLDASLQLLPHPDGGATLALAGRW